MTRAAQLRQARAIVDCIPEWERNKRERYVLIRYKLLPSEYRDLIDSQNNKCAICFSPPRSPHKYLLIDHDHKTEKVRGLLCHGCNIAIGMLKDDVQTARAIADYLEKHQNLASQLVADQSFINNRILDENNP